MLTPVQAYKSDFSRSTAKVFLVAILILIVILYTSIQVSYMLYARYTLYMYVIKLHVIRAYIIR